MKSGDKERTNSKATAREAREVRLATALRANLRRRKATAPADRPVAAGKDTTKPE
jgi:hypothetical protein